MDPISLCRRSTKEENQEWVKDTEISMSEATLDSSQNHSRALCTVAIPPPPPPPPPPLSYAMRQTKPLESGAARHLLIQASTIFGNLILTDTQPTEDIDGYRKRFCGILRKSLNQQQSVPEYVKRACSFLNPPMQPDKFFH